MHSLSYDGFVAAWSTYWGRREIGYVLDNALAAQIASSQDSLRFHFTQWGAALEVFPEDSPIWLMGTPDLTPELLPARPPESVGPPPVARIGPYATDDPSVFSFSERAGDYEIHFPRDTEAARLGRSIVRAKPGVIISFTSLVTASLPLLSIPLALVGLVWTSQAHWRLHRHFRATPLPWRARGPLLAGQLAAVLSIALAVTLALPRLLVPTPDLKEEIAMSQAFEESLTGGIIDRLRQHWPEIDVSAEFAEGDFDSPTMVRVRVATDVYLDAIPGEITWSARPMSDASGEFAPVAGSRAYGFGATTSDGAELIADRFYEEVRFWWAKLHPSDAQNEQSI